jgi:hypothetical protein
MKTINKFKLYTLLSSQLVFGKNCLKCCLCQLSVCNINIKVAVSSTFFEELGGRSCKA